MFNGGFGLADAGLIKKGTKVQRDKGTKVQRHKVVESAMNWDADFMMIEKKDCLCVCRKRLRRTNQSKCGTSPLVICYLLKGEK